MHLWPVSRGIFLGALVGWTGSSSEAQARTRAPSSVMERPGQFSEAADVYFAILRADPTNATALLGLERVLPTLNRLPELVPLAERAVALRSEDPDLEGLMVRLWVVLGVPDSARAAAARWGRRKPGDPMPYRELAFAFEDQGAFAAARSALVSARETLGEPGAFAVELAELDARAGDWESAARDWAGALAGRPGPVANAAALLVTAPEPRRTAVIGVLTGAEGPGAVAARRLAAELLLSWVEPSRAWAVFEPTVRQPSDEATSALERFADLAAAGGTAAGWRVRGLALGRLADFDPRDHQSRARAEAGRAFLEAGDLRAAREQFEPVMTDPAAPLDARQLATATLVQALVAEGQLDSATATLAHADELTADERTGLRLELAEGWIRTGELGRAASALAEDSNLAVVAEHGWIALYRGDLARGRSLLSAAGPYAGDRHEATERAAVLALTERIPVARFPAIGRALLALARRDSSGAVAALRAAGTDLAPEAGRADVLLLAARVAARLGSQGAGVAVGACADILRTPDAGAAAPAAELLWAQLLERQGETALVVQHLEHLILTYPESAVVPEARRALERVRGTVPRS